MIIAQNRGPLEVSLTVILSGFRKYWTTDKTGGTFRGSGAKGENYKRLGGLPEADRTRRKMVLLPFGRCSVFNWSARRVVSVSPASLPAG